MNDLSAPVVSETVVSDTAVSSAAASTATPAHNDTLQGRIDALKEAHADRFDPARFRFIESLAQRLHRHNGSAKSQLEQRALGVLDHFCADYEQARAQAQELVAGLTAEDEEVSNQLSQQLQYSEFDALRRFAHRQQRAHRADSANRRALLSLTDILNGEKQLDDDNTHTPLARRLRQQERRVSRHISGHNLHTGEELKSIVEFRDSWNKLRRTQLVDDSVSQGPRDAGPLNPERLAIRSLSAMAELSPQYLNRFVSYVETLLWLQQIEHRNQSNTRKKPPRK